MSEMDKAEQARLEQALAQAERLLITNPSHGGSWLATTIIGTQQRLEAMDREGVFGSDQEKREKCSKAALELALLVAQESKLNTKEKEQYAEFLGKPYFTRKDLKEGSVP